MNDEIDFSGDPEEDVAHSVDGFLLALADGINKAQRQLSQISIAVQSGRPAITYQLPKLDFEFRVTFELSKPGSAEGGALAPSGLSLRPAQSGGPAEASSVIKGSFVAVPALGGKPPPTMHIELGGRSARRLQIDVFLTSAAGENLEGVPVQFNLDHALSRSLSKEQPAPVELLDFSQTDVWHGLVQTDDQGIAKNVLDVAETVPQNAFIALKVDAIGETQTVVFKVEEE